VDDHPGGVDGSPKGRRALGLKALSDAVGHGCGVLGRRSREGTRGGPLFAQPSYGFSNALDDDLTRQPLEKSLNRGLLQDRFDGRDREDVHPVGLSPWLGIGG
jgi:hypothetical protein